MSTVNKMQYIRKQLTWDEVVDLFPDLWVVFKDCEYENIDFIKGTLIDVIEDKDRIEYMNKHQKEEIYIDRTTDSLSSGYIHAEIIREEI